VLPVAEQLADGSYLSRSYAALGKNRPARPAVVRVIEYTPDAVGTVCRLITTILDPERAPAADLAVLYAQRWNIEVTFDELKSHQGAPRMVLRSQSPPGVEQEAWGLLLAHYAIRALMHRAAPDAGPDLGRTR
jgi:Transposase DDE domain